MALIRLCLAGVCALLAAVLISPLVVAGLPFFLVSRLTRLWARGLEPRYTPWGALIAFDERFGWRPRGGMRSWHMADDLFWSSTDPEGWRDDRVRLEASKIVVIGDSFAWGLGIDDRDFFGGRLRSPRAKAIGTIGYSMVQELLWMRELAPSFRGKVVVWLVYLGNDLHDNITPSLGRYRRPFVRQLDGTGEWEIVTRHISPAKWPLVPETHEDGVDYYRKLAEVCSETMFADRVFSACRWVMREGRDVCRAAGAHLVVMSVPDSMQLSPQGTERLLRHGGDRASFDPGLPDRKLRTICEGLDVPFVAGSEYFRATDYKERDCHWNRVGHRRMADLLDEVYRTRVLENDEPKAREVAPSSLRAGVRDAGAS